MLLLYFHHSVSHNSFYVLYHWTILAVVTLAFSDLHLFLLFWNINFMRRNNLVFFFLLIILSTAPRIQHRRYSKIFVEWVVFKNRFELWCVMKNPAYYPSSALNTGIEFLLLSFPLPPLQHIYCNGELEIIGEKTAISTNENTEMVSSAGLCWLYEERSLRYYSQSGSCNRFFQSQISACQEVEKMICDQRRW